MGRSQLQFNLGTVMLAVALIAALMALLVHLGRSAVILALTLAQGGITAIIYGKTWMSCRKAGREPTGDDYLAAERSYRRFALIFLGPLWLAAGIWFFCGRP